MIRKLALALSILAVLVTPQPAHGGGGHGGPGHHGHHHHRHRFIGVVYAPFPYALCWEEGHWVDQLYMDRSGASTLVPLWVPPHWGCWY